ARRPGSSPSSRSASTTKSRASGASGRRWRRGRKPSGASGSRISTGDTPDRSSEAPHVTGGGDRIDNMAAEALSGRGVEWNEVRALLAAETDTPMGRDRALGATPLLDLPAVSAALNETSQARLAVAAHGSRMPAPRGRIARDRGALFRAPDAARIFSARYVTRRNGRYVVPVRAEARARLRGIVHDRSQSGQTVFLEPDRVVDANNDL